MLASTDPVTIYNGVEFMYPLTQVVVDEFSEYLHDLTYRNLDAAIFDDTQKGLSVVQERLDFNIETLERLGPRGCSQTGEILGDLKYLPLKTISFSDTILKRQHQRQTALETEVAQKNLTAAEMSVRQAIKAAELADKQLASADSVLKLTKLAAILVHSALWG